MVGLQVAPTQPKEIDWRSSSGSAESFHRTVGVVRVAVRSGPGVYSMLINCSLRGVRPRVASSPGVARDPIQPGRSANVNDLSRQSMSRPSPCRDRPAEAGANALNSAAPKEYPEPR